MTKYILTVVSLSKTRDSVTSQAYHLDYEVDVINTAAELEKDLGRLFSIHYSFVKV